MRKSKRLTWRPNGVLLLAFEFWNFCNRLLKLWHFGVNDHPHSSLLFSSYNIFFLKINNDNNNNNNVD